MSLRRQRPSDSLDMLLDTMCNTFGGIILLAVLVTLLTSQERRGSATTATDTHEMLQRRLTLAQADLDKAKQLQNSLDSKSADPRWKAQVAKLRTRAQLQAQINEIQTLAARSGRELEASASSDPAERARTLNAQLTAAQVAKATAQNSLNASKDNTNRLTARIAGLEIQVIDRVKESQRQLRLPREHETGKRVIYAIARYGRIYMCRNTDLSRNETDIAWTSLLSSDTAEPRPGRGIDPANSAASLSAYFRALPTGSTYVAFCVFEDSFPAFIRARQLASDQGLAYGWEPFTIAHGPVVFGPIGHTPLPQ